MSSQTHEKAEVEQTVRAARGQPSPDDTDTQGLGWNLTRCRWCESCSLVCLSLLVDYLALRRRKCKCLLPSACQITYGCRRGGLDLLGRAVRAPDQEWIGGAVTPAARIVPTC